jgi:hypothetical protein
VGEAQPLQRLGSAGRAGRVNPRRGAGASLGVRTIITSRSSGTAPAVPPTPAKEGITCIIITDIVIVGVVNTKHRGESSVSKAHCAQENREISVAS